MTVRRCSRSWPCSTHAPWTSPSAEGRPHCRTASSRPTSNFISWLPIPDPLPLELADAGQRLHELAAAAEQEQAGFFDWLESVFGVRVPRLAGWTKLAGYATHGTDAVLDVLDANAARLATDPRSRASRERVQTETLASADRANALRAEQLRIEAKTDALVYDAYRLPESMRSRIDREFDAPGQ